MAERFTTLSELDSTIQEITSAYRSAVLYAIAEGIQEGAKVFKKTAQEVSPVDTGEYKKSWKIKPMRKAKFVRYVGNTKKVKAHAKDAEPTIPLINILEFSKGKRARPHIGQAINNSKDEIISLISSKIQKEGK
jgi:hypothetical protein